VRAADGRRRAARRGPAAQQAVGELQRARRHAARALRRAGGGRDPERAALRRPARPHGLLHVGRREEPDVSARRADAACALGEHDDPLRGHARLHAALSHDARGADAGAPERVPVAARRCRRRARRDRQQVPRRRVDGAVPRRGPRAARGAGGVRDRGRVRGAPRGMGQADERASGPDRRAATRFATSPPSAAA
jgi:hypothetical protein